MSAMSVSASAPDHFRAQAAAVGELDGDPIGVLDDVMIREDVALVVDDEAGAGAAARAVAAAAAEFERIVERVGARRREARSRRQPIQAA